MKTQHKHTRRGLAIMIAIALLFSIVGPQMAFASTAGVKQVAAGYGHTMVLKTDGTLWATGLNANGQLGDGTTTNATTFKQVLTDVSQVAAGENHTLALKTDGSLWVAGRNGFGQLGVDAGQVSVVGFKQALTEVAQIAAGKEHSLALKTNGTLWGVGYNGSGQLGLGSKYNIYYGFTQSLTGVKSVVAGDYFSMAIKTDGTLWMAGDNEYGALGNGSTTKSVFFAQVLSDVSSVAAGGAHAMAIKTDNTLWGAGRNTNGELGASPPNTRLFSQVLTNVKQVSAGYAHTLAVKTDGTLWTTGYNGQGQLGDNTTTKSTVFKQVASDAETAETGYYNTFLLKTDNSLLATGINDSGQLGDGTTMSKTVFVTVMSAPPSPLEIATNAVIEAETIQIQSSIDVARFQVIALPDGPDKDALTDRLNVVQATVDARVAAEAALTTGTLESINIAMTLVNAMPDSAEKAVLIQQLQEAQTEAEANAYPIGTDGGNVTVNAFINPTITLSMDTHVVDFNASDPTVASYEKPAVIGLTVQSNNTYRLTARALDDFKTGGETPLVMAADHLKAKASTSADFLAMSKNADAVLLQDMPNTGGAQHKLDFRFDSDWQMKPGAYSTTIKIMASQL